MRTAVCRSPEHVRLLAANVDIREDMGSEVFIHFAIAAPPVRGEDIRAAVGEEALEATRRRAQPSSRAAASSAA